MTYHAGIAPFQPPDLGGAPIWYFGFNFRESAGHVADDTPNHFASRTMAYPTSFPGMTERAGFPAATPDFDSDYTPYPGGEQRLAGRHVAGQDIRWVIELPAAGKTYRFRMGSYTETANWGSDPRIYDGVDLGGPLLWSGTPVTGLVPFDIVDILGNKTDAATWTANYANNYVDVTPTLPGVRFYWFLAPPEVWSIWSHLSIEQITP